MARNCFSVAGVEADGRQHQHVQPVPGRHACALFTITVPSSFGTGGRHYAVTRDGTRFLVNLIQRQADPTPLTVVVNWLSAASEIVISRPFRT